MALGSPQIIDTSGIRLPKDAFVVIVRTEWNAPVVDLLQTGCINVLTDHQVQHSIVSVPGAFEILFGIKNFWDNHTDHNTRPHAFIALGCILKGDTPHFKYVCNAVTDGIVQLNLLLPVPTIFGVLTVNNQEQADERTGGKHGNKGAESAATALKMISLCNSFKK